MMEQIKIQYGGEDKYRGKPRDERIGAHNGGQEPDAEQHGCGAGEEIEKGAFFHAQRIEDGGRQRRNAHEQHQKGGGRE